MGDRQIYFSLGVGLSTTLLGYWANLVSNSGMNLALLGIGLSILAVGVKLHAFVLSTRKETVFTNTVSQMKDKEAKTSLTGDAVRDAA